MSIAGERRLYFATNSGRNAVAQMRDATLPGGPLQPFADDAAGAGYFGSDHHHRYLAEGLVRQLAKGCNVVLVSGAPPADGELLTRFVDEVGSKYRASVVACRAGMNFNDVMLAYSRQLGIGVNRDKGRLWALLSHLMLETRRGVSRVLILDHAETLDALCFDELLRFSQLDAPRPVPIVLLAPPTFAEVLTTPALDFINAAITGRLAVDRLAPEEVGAFIQYQLNGHSEGGKTPFSSELIALIATAADGNPAVVNALSREIVLSAKPRRLTVDEMREPDALPVERAEAPPASVETTAAATDPEPTPTEEPPRRRARRQGMDLQIAGYLALSVLIGAGLLYALLPGRSPPVAPATTSLILPAAESGAAAAAPIVPPETAAAAATDTPPSEPVPPTQDASVDAAPPTVEPDAPSPTLPAAESADNAAPPAPEPPVPSPPIESSDNAAPAPPAAPPAASPEPPVASAEPPEATAAAPSATGEALAKVEPQAAPPPEASVPPPQETSVPPPQVATVPPPVVVPPPQTEAASAEVTVMLQRGDELLADGDVFSARQFYQRAAIGGNAAALCGVGKSFDPLVLRNIGVLGVAGDAATAVLWYRKAAEAGSEEASLRLKRLAAVHRLDWQKR
jgi:type II secretory pathway predicted ATPase ExeA